MKKENEIGLQMQEVQKYVLGCFMVEESFFRAEEFLHDDCFDHGIPLNTYKCIKALHKQGVTINSIVVSQKYAEDYGRVNGAEFFMMCNEVNRTDNLEYLCKQLKSYAVYKQLLSHSKSIPALLTDSEPIIALESLQKELDNFASLAHGGDTKSFQSSVIEELNDIGERMASDKNIFGLPTGFTLLDKVTGGWNDSELIILAARPGMGKTAFALDTAKAVAKHILSTGEKGAVAISSLEMSIRQLIKRLIVSEAQVDSDRVKKGTLTKEELEKVMHAAGVIHDLPIEVNDKQGQSISELRSFCMKVKNEKGLSMIVVDYLQLMRDSDHKGDKTGEITAISQGLKGLAKDFNVPVIALSQLNRAVETRGGNKIPMLSDLRDSGSIEQDADMVAFLYRPEYYGITQDEDGESTEGKAYVIIAKNRDGDLDTCHLRFKGRYTRFEDWQEEGEFYRPPTTSMRIDELPENLEPNF